MTFSSTSQTKPIIHHIPSNINSTQSLPKSDHTISLDSNLPNHTNNNSIAAGLVLTPGDVWSQVVLRVIPLFNGEGHRGFIEDLNDFVSQHIHKTIADSPSKSISKLHSDITELFANGVIILNNKLQPDQLSDQRLLARVVEVWHFFFTSVLPYLEAIFLPLMSDENLLNVIESKNNKDLQERLQQQHLLQQATTNARLFSSTSSSLLFRPSNRNIQHSSRHRSTGSHGSRAEDVIQEIDIRKLALLAFRQHLCLPIFSRLYHLFAMLYDPTTWRKLHGPINIAVDIQAEHMHLKRLQMVGLLSSVQTNDTQQAMIEELSKLIRLKKAKSDLLKLPTASLKNLPLRTVSANSNGSAISPRKSNELDKLSDRDRSGSGSSSSHSQQQQQQQQQSCRLNSNPSPSNPSKADSHEYDDDRPLVRILEDEDPSQQIKGWNKNRDFARRSIRRQLSRSGTNGRASKDNQDSRHQQRRQQQAPQPQQGQQQQQQQQQEEPSELTTRRRIRRNRETQSVSRALEDVNPDSSMNKSTGSPSMTPSNSNFSTQATQKPSLDAGVEEEQSLEHLNDNAYNGQSEWSLGHRNRLVFGQKTGSGSSSGSIMSIMGPPKQNGATVGPHRMNNNNSTTMNTLKSSVNHSLDDIDNGSMSSVTGLDMSNLINTTKPLVIHPRSNNNTSSSSSTTSSTLNSSQQPHQIHSSQLNLNIQPIRSSSNANFSHNRSLSSQMTDHTLLHHHHHHHHHHPLHHQHLHQNQNHLNPHLKSIESTANLTHS